MDHTRFLATTNDGRLGWVPAGAQIGDRLCLLQGCPASFIVRETGDDHYEIVGDTYIKGVMRGEAWPKIRHHVHSIGFK